MPLFSFLLPNNSRHKDNLKPTELEAELFIRNLKNRGHKKGEKDESAIVGAKLRPGGRLELKDVEVATALILDIDGKFKREGQVVHEVVDPDWLLPKIGFRGIAHTSYSHTPEFPKYRVILPLEEPISVAEHHRLWWWMFERLERKVDPSTKDASRLFFLPRYAEGSDKSIHWMRDLQGPWLSMAAVPADYEVPEAYTPLAPRRKQGAHAAPPSASRKVSGHALVEKLLQLPLYEWAMENPTEVTREVWRGLAVNLAAATLDDPTALDSAREAFHTVSEPDDERYNVYITNKTFDDAIKSASQFGPMTYATMQLNGAPEDVCTTKAMEYKAPIAQARGMVKENPPPKTDAPAAALSPASGASQSVTASPSKESAPQTSTGTAQASEPPEDEDTGEDDYTKHPPSEFLHDLSEDKYYSYDKKLKKWVGPFGSGALAQQLLSWGLPRPKQDAFRAQITSYSHREAIFDSEAQLVKTGSFPIFNTYLMPQVEAVKGDWSDIKTVLMNLVGGDKEGYEYLLDWLATPVQHLYTLKPDGSIVLHLGAFKMGTAVVLHGDPGAGKGTLEQILTYIYGVDYVATIGQEALDGRFNGELKDKLFVVCNEVMSSTNRSTATANKIKPWVTDKYIPVEAKFRGAERVKNQFNILFASNDERPVIIDKNDRRYTVFKTGPQLPKDVTDRLYADMEGPKTQLKALLHRLLTRKCTLRYGELYKTAAREEMMKLSGPSDEKFVENLIEEGWFAIAAPWVEGGTDQHPREFTVADNIVLNDTLNEVYQFWCRRHGVKPRSAVQLGKTVSKMIPDTDSVRIRHGGAQRRGWRGLPMGDADVKAEAPPESTQNEKKTPDTDDGDFS